MRSLLLGAALMSLLLAAAGDTPAAEPTIVRPYESARPASPTPLDAPVLAAQHALGIEPARLCSDEVFVRRVYVDVIGTLPEPAEARRFLQDKRPDKRAALIEDLLQREEFADYWSLRWCDVLRVKAEFPINLWPNAVQAYHRWVHDAIRRNLPYDRFARELLTSSGSNFRVPAVNFWRAVQGRDPPSLAGAVALTFMGSRMERWPDEERRAFATVFSRVAYKATAEWKEEIVLLDPAASGALDAILPDGSVLHVPAGEDPRRAFADWLIAPENPWCARTVVNRVWAWLFGRGIVHEADDLRPDNPPSVPDLLEYLESELVASGWDLRQVYRVILNSSTYQQSPIPQTRHPDAASVFACYPVRRLDAEVLIDALCWIGGEGERYSSTIPEPFTFVPPENRSIELADGSITSQFLEKFGRPARDTGLLSERSNAATDAQRLHLLNSSDVQRRIARSRRLRAAFDGARGDPREMVRMAYLTLLSRAPEASEWARAEAYVRKAGSTPRQGAEDLAWALVNTKEFLFRH